MAVGRDTAPAGMTKTDTPAGKDPRVAEVLDFWFGPKGSAERGRPRACWFVKDAAFDETIRARFLTLWETASRAELDAWRTQLPSALALVIMLDQFSRNLFRGDPRSFSQDGRALAVAKHMVEEGFDQDMLAVERWFVYLPFEHSESTPDQQRSLELFGNLSADPDSASAIDYARRHHDVIRRFGRFPHRNEILGRPSTPEELAFLQEPGSRF